MFSLVAPILASLVAYTSGRALLPFFVAAPGKPLSHRLLLECLIGNLVVGLTGLLLAQLGCFSLALLLVSVAGVSAGAVLIRRQRCGLSSPVSPYAPADAAGLALAALVFLWAYPPMDTMLYGFDSSVYVASGIHSARHGALAAHDPTISRFSRREREALFPAYSTHWKGPPYIRVPGGLLLTSLDGDTMLPAFHPLLTIWVAILYALGGDQGVPMVAPYFSALSAWAVAAFGAALGGLWAAAAAISLMLLALPQYWYSRFTMPEVPTQYLLWAGLLTAVLSLRDRQPRLGLIAGASLGVAGLMRLDSLLRVVSALALWKAFAPRGSWPGGRRFTFAFALLAAYTGLHHTFFPTHYVAEIAYGFRMVLRAVHNSSALAPLAAAMAVTAFFLALRTGRRGASFLGIATETAARLSALVVFATYIAATFGPSPAQVQLPLSWLRTYLGWPLLAAALAGALLWLRYASASGQRFALLLAVLVTAELLHDPHVSPAPLWGIRRFLPVALPALFLSAGVAMASLGRWSHWTLALAALSVVAVVPARHLAGAYREPAYEHTTNHVRAIAALIPEGSVVTGSPDLFRRSQLHIALWGVRDTLPFLVRRQESARLLRLRRSIPDRRMFWIGYTYEPLAARKGLRLVAIATYRFAVGTRRIRQYDRRDKFGFRAVDIAIYEVIGIGASGLSPRHPPTPPRMRVRTGRFPRLKGRGGRGHAQLLEE